MVWRTKCKRNHSRWPTACYGILISASLSSSESLSFFIFSTISLSLKRHSEMPAATSICALCTGLHAFVASMQAQGLAGRQTAVYSSSALNSGCQCALPWLHSCRLDWSFIPVSGVDLFVVLNCCMPTDGQRLLRILENDLILKHDTIWPHGLNNTLHIEAAVEVTEFRRSCLRHRWPPEYDTATRPETELDLDRVRKQISAAPPGDLASSPSSSSLHSSTASTPVGSAPAAISTSRGTHHHDDTNNDRPGNAPLTMLFIHSYGVLEGAVAPWLQT